MSIRSLPAYIIGQVGSTEPRLLFKGEQPAIYAAPGYLLFPLAGNLVARPFDLTRLEFSGDPIPLFPLSSFAQDWRGRIIVSASDTGRLTHAIVESPRKQFLNGWDGPESHSDWWGSRGFTRVLISRRTAGGSRSTSWVSGCTTWSTTACNV